MSLTLKRVRELLDYDPETGVFRWRIDRHPGNGTRNRAGDVAGTIKNKSSEWPYLVIWVDGVLHRAHRLAWFYMTGEWPAEVVDHIDGNGLNNAWSNLRSCRQQQNNGNHKRLNKHNTSGFRGVTWKRDKRKWKAFINRDDRQYHLGYFDTAEAAYEAYKAAAIEHFGEFARV